MSKNFDSASFIKQILYEYNPDIDTRPSTAFYDLFLKPNTYLLQPMLDDATAISMAQTINNIESMTEDEADALIANYTISRISGGVATGSVRFYYNTLTEVSVDEGTVVLSDTGLRYLSTFDVRVSKESLALNTEGGYYYVDIDFEAAEYGDEYNILPGKIISTEVVVNNVTKVNNIYNFSGGGTRETNAQLADRAIDALSVKNLLSSRSINTLLYENFSEIRNIITVGKDDSEMIRDVITATIDGTNFDVHIGGAADIYTDIHSDYLQSASADSTALATVPASVYRKISSSGTSNSTTAFIDGSGNFSNIGITPGHTLRIKSGVDTGDYVIASIDSDTQISTTEAITFTDSDISYEILDQDSEWSAPLVQITQVDRLDPGTLTESGIQLCTGREVLVDPTLVSLGSDPELEVDSTDGIHCVFSKDDDIWYTKISNAGITEIPAMNISNSTHMAINPDIIMDSSNNMSIVWESDDATTDKFDLMLSVLDLDGTSVVSPTVIIDDLNSSFSSASLSSNPNGLNICHVMDSTALRFSILDVADYATVSIYTEIYTASSIGTPRSVTDGAYVFVTASDGSSIFALKINAAGTNIITPIASSIETYNVDPAIAVDSDSNIYLSWATKTDSIYMSKYNEVGTEIYSPAKLMTLTEYAKNPRIYIDNSGKVHLIAIDENLNSGDVNYAKFDTDLSLLVGPELVQDHYNNANYGDVVLDSNRRPHIIWDSYDNRSSRFYYTKRQSQDYKLISLDDRYRYSMLEIVNIKVDPAYSSDYLRFNYKYIPNIENIDEYVRSTGSLDRVVVASYLVKHPIPSFIDISLEYSGSDTSAQTIITDYINNTTSGSISVSEIISILPSSIAARVTIPFYINSERHNSDGSITITRSNNIIDESRIAKFIARDIVVS